MSGEARRLKDFCKQAWNIVTVLQTINVQDNVKDYSQHLTDLSNHFDFIVDSEHVKDMQYKTLMNDLNEYIVIEPGPSIMLRVQADAINPGVFAIDSKPYGIPYAENAGIWNRWLISVPQPVNPATDPTGKNCAQNQAGPVWFLAGTTGGSAERTCTIPAGKAILSPVMGSECDYASYPNVKSESQLVLCAQADNNRAITKRIQHKYESRLRL